MPAVPTNISIPSKIEPTAGNGGSISSVSGTVSLLPGQFGAGMSVAAGGDDPPLLVVEEHDLVGAIDPDAPSSAQDLIDAIAGFAPPPAALSITSTTPQRAGGGLLAGPLSLD